MIQGLFCRIHEVDGVLRGERWVAACRRVAPGADAARVDGGLRAPACAVDQLLGVQIGDWSLARDDGVLTAADVERLAGEVLAEYSIVDPAAEGWGTLVIPPRLADFQLANGVTPSCG